MEPDQRPNSREYLSFILQINSASALYFNNYFFFDKTSTIICHLKTSVREFYVKRMVKVHIFRDNIGDIAYNGQV